MYDDEIHNEELPGAVRRMLHDLPRERAPGAHLEERIATELRRQDLLGRPRLATTTPPRALRMRWPAAAAAALVLFLSGVAVGAATGNRRIPAPTDVAANSSSGPALAQPPADLLLFTTDSVRSVRRAVWY